MTRVVKILLPIIILALGLGAYQLLASKREPPQKAERSYLGPLVEAIADGAAPLAPGAVTDGARRGGARNALLSTGAAYVGGRPS